MTVSRVGVPEFLASHLKPMTLDEVLEYTKSKKRTPKRNKKVG